MKHKMFYRTQVSASKVLNDIIDSYFDGKVEEKEMIELITEIIKRNSHILVRDDEIRSTTVQRLGKKRSHIVVGIFNKLNKGELEW